MRARANRHTLTALATCILLTGMRLSCPAAQSDTLSASITTRHVYLGDSATLTVSIHGAEKVKPPDLTAIRNCQVEALGSHEEDRPSIVVRDGEPRPHPSTAHVYLYKVTPEKAGPTVLGPISAVADGKSVTIDGPHITVIPPTTDRSVSVRLTASKQRVLVTETFNVLVEVEVLGRVSGAEDTRIDAERAPRLDVPFLTVAETRGIRGPRPRAILGPRLVQRNADIAFGINGYTVRIDAGDNGVFDIAGITGDSPATFRLDRESETRNGAPVIIYSLSLPFSAIEEGAYQLGPVAFKGPVLVASDTGPGQRYVYTRSRAVQIRVDAPPEEGRPATYSGAVGRSLSVVSRITTNTCRLGEPVDLVVSLEGDIGFENTSAPVLDATPGLEGRFHLYGGDIDYSESGKAADFQYILRALEPGILEVPPLEVSYFNTATRTYETVTTEPLPLYVGPPVDAAGQTATQPAGIRVSLRSRLPDDLDFQWRAACARMGRARTAAEFADAAKLYERIAARNVRDGELFYNAGTAWLAAGRYADALRNFRRAEIRMGWDIDLVHNTRLAEAGSDATLVRPIWQSLLLTWHYGPALRIRVRVLLAAGILFLVLAGIRLVTRPRRLATSYAICGLVVLMLALSVLVSLRQERTSSSRASSGIKQEAAP